MLFSHKKSIGIDIADHTIEVVELDKNREGSALASVGRMKIEAGIVEKGRIKDAPRLAQAVKDVLRDSKPKPIEAHSVIFGLPESHVYLHVFTLSDDKKTPRDRRIFEEARKNIPIPEKDLLFAHRVLYESDEGVEILLAATSKEIVREWQDFFKTLEIEVEVFDIETLATYRGLSFPRLSDPVSVIDMGSSTTQVSVFDSSGLRYAYTSRFGGEDFTRALAKEKELSFEEAEKQKQELSGKGGDEGGLSVESILQPVVRDLKETYQYFHDQTGETVSEIILVGGSSLLAGLPEHLSRKLGVSVKRGQQTLFTSKIPLVFIEALGLALRGINDKWDERDPAFVLPKERPSSEMVASVTQGALSRVKQLFKSSDTKSTDDDPDRKIRRQKKILLALVLLAVVAIPASYWYKAGRESDKQKEMEEKLETVDKNIEKEKQNDPVVLEGKMETGEAVGEDENDNSKDMEEEERKVVITDTPVGWLNVREGPGTNFSFVRRISPGETYVLLEEKDNWYKIRIDEDVEGWVTSQYANTDE